VPTQQVILLAIVQGITEFLPVSSSAHLILLRRFMGWNELSASQELTFDVALHTGTLIAVLIYFASTWLRLLRAAFSPKQQNSVASASKMPVSASPATSDRLLFWFLMAATIPGAIAGKLLESTAEDYFRQQIALIAFAMIGVALLMLWSEKIGALHKPLSATTLGDALVIGAAQAFAIIPGVSRSGSTIAAGLFRGMTREAAVRFSFLLSTPIIAGAAILKGLHLRHQPVSHEMLVSLLLGIIVSAVVGFASIAVLVRYLRTETLKIFIVYRVIFGIIILALVFRGYFH
jgi:undecaprenyl-diphosphatase